MDWKILMMPTYLHGLGQAGKGSEREAEGGMQLPRAELNWKLATDNWQPAVAWCEVCQNGKSWQLRMQSGPLPCWGSMLDDRSTGTRKQHDVEARRDEADGWEVARQLTGTKISCNCRRWINFTAIYCVYLFFRASSYPCPIPWPYMLLPPQ